MSVRFGAFDERKAWSGVICLQSNFVSVVKRFNTLVCKTSIRRFESDPELLEIFLIYVYTPIAQSGLERLSDTQKVKGSNPFRSTLLKNRLMAGHQTLNLANEGSNPSSSINKYRMRLRAC